ncbi:S-layer homology domain-containing protein [Paenibacillus sp. 1P07SE]|uniref:S-layer homology domain-containing protein n=1 Tax=Paenibacillus sp. 1P07SE TaxID=3132209 RepID=UPI0039A46F31
MKRRVKLWLTSVLLFAAIPMSALAEDDPPGVSTQVSGQDPTYFILEAVPSGGQLEVTVAAREATDVYAYELQLTFDALRWRLIDTVTQQQGFSLEPIVSGHRLRVAHTQMGHSEGKNGDIDLAVLTFERIRSGDSQLGLDAVRLVNTDIAGVDYEPGLTVELADDRAAGVQLSDIKGHWAEEIIGKAVNLGFVTGYEDGTFKPQNEVTRAQFAVMLARALMLPADNGEAARFSDQDAIPAWAGPHIASAVRAGLVTGYEDGTFRAHAPITRMEMAAVIVRALEISETVPDQQHFSDHDRIPAWGQSYAAAAAEAGLMQGRTDGSFAPDERATRAEAATVILNALQWQMQ